MPLLFATPARLRLNISRAHTKPIKERYPCRYIPTLLPLIGKLKMEIEWDRNLHPGFVTRVSGLKSSRRCAKYPTAALIAISDDQVAKKSAIDVVQGQGGG